MQAVVRTRTGRARCSRPERRNRGSVTAMSASPCARPVNFANIMARTGVYPPDQAALPLGYGCWSGQELAGLTDVQVGQQVMAGTVRRPGQIVACPRTTSSRYRSAASAGSSVMVNDATADWGRRRLRRSARR